MTNSAKSTEAAAPADSSRRVCSALSLASDAWAKKRLRPDLPLQFVAIIDAESADEMADQLEYIAMRLRENGWSAGSGGGKSLNLVWEMFRKPNAERSDGATSQPTKESEEI